MVAPERLEADGREAGTFIELAELGAGRVCVEAQPFPAQLAGALLREEQQLVREATAGMAAPDGQLVDDQGGAVVRPDRGPGSVR